DVFLEFPGEGIYKTPFFRDRWRVWEPEAYFEDESAKPYLLIPHLNWQELKKYLKFSSNSLGVKVNMFLLYFFSSYRTYSFIKEKKYHLFNIRPYGKDFNLVGNGGIRNDNFKAARIKAVKYAERIKEPGDQEEIHSFEELNKSSVAYLNNLITKNGGTLYL